MTLLCACCSISTVYKALCSISKETVIIKAYEKAKMKTKNFLRMEREIKLMNCLRGEGLAQLYGVFEDPTHKTLVMEYCKGGDLFKLLLLKGGSLDEHWVCCEVGAGLDAMQCPALPCNVMQCSAVQCSVLLCTPLH